VEVPVPCSREARPADRLRVSGRLTPTLRIAFLVKAVTTCGTGLQRRSPQISCPRIRRQSSGSSVKVSYPKTPHLEVPEQQNNIIEADRGALKRVILPTSGYQTMRTAAPINKRFEIMRIHPERSLPHMQAMCLNRSARILQNADQLLNATEPCQF